MSAELRRLEIRPYEMGDAAGTLDIFTAAITRTAAADYSPEQIDAWARPGLRDVDSWHLAMSGRNSFVATLDNELAGFSDVGPTGHIDMMFVAPQHHRQGVARALLSEAESQARASGLESLTADVSITARAFFEHHGFVVEQRQEPVVHGVTLVNFRMRKSLLQKPT